MRSIPCFAIWSPLLGGLVALAMSLPAGAAASELHVGSGEPRTLSFRDPTPVRDVYRSLGEAWNLYVAFDSDLPDRNVTVELLGVTAAEAFTRVTRAAGHLYLVAGERSILIAEDTPTKRSLYETLVLRLFVVEHVDASDVSQLFARLLQLEDTAALDENRVVLVRGTAAQVETAAALVRSLDQPRGEIELDVDLLLLEGSSARLPRRLAVGELKELRGGARILAEPALAMLDRDTARWQLREELVVSGGTELTTIKAGLALSVRPRMHMDGEVTLEVATAWTDLEPSARESSAMSELVEAESSGQGLPSPRTITTDETREQVRELLRRRLRELERALQEATVRKGKAQETTVELAVGTLAGEWSARLRPGETLLVSGILPGVGRRGLLAAALGADDTESEIVLALTPRVARGRALPDDFEIICAAAEGLTGLCGRASD